MRSILSLFVVLTLAATTGCSFSNSSGSISDSISSPSTSISDSSSGGDDSSSDENEAPAPETTEDTASYQQDVSQLTVTYIKSGGDVDAFITGISDLAAARGITNWEADSETAQAIGVGAGNAGLQEAAFDDFGKQLFRDDLTKLNELRIGYQQTAPAETADAMPSVATPPVATPPVATPPAPPAESAAPPEAQPDAS